ncbi:hypothetical protein Hanom_Chr02g00133691 [Helianthus anomalus]
MHHLNEHMELNMRAYDENQWRRHSNYYQGVPYVENPPYVDYSREARYQPCMARHPALQVHGSMWVPLEYTTPHSRALIHTFRHHTSTHLSRSNSHNNRESHQQEDWPISLI